ncbi:MAG: serine/threonine-protein kinase [Hyphomicrobiaceae bacterium]
MGHKQTLAPDTVLLDEFKILDLLGSGGFANTYLAHDNSLGRDVAIKEFFPSGLAVRGDGDHVHVRTADRDEQFQWAMRRFVREAKTLAKFRHPSVVRVFRVFKANGTAYIVLEFVRGSNMDAWLKGLQRPPTQAEFDTLLPPLLDALEVVHGAGILHRDIKPANIYIRAVDNCPVLLDFGAAAQARGSNTSEVWGAMVSKGYSPSESYATDASLQGPWSDIYGLAATAYKALTGAAPPESTKRAIDDRYVSATQVAGAEGYRPDFLAALDKALAIMPADRPQSVRQWRKELMAGQGKRRQTVDANEAPATSPPTTIDPAVPFRRLADEAPLTTTGGSGSGGGAGTGGRREARRQTSTERLAGTDNAVTTSGRTGRRTRGSATVLTGSGEDDGAASARAGRYLMTGVALIAAGIVLLVVLWLQKPSSPVLRDAAPYGEDAPQIEAEARAKAEADRKAAEAAAKAEADRKAAEAAAKAEADRKAAEAAAKTEADRKAAEAAAKTEADRKAAAAAAKAEADRKAAEAAAKAEADRKAAAAAAKAEADRKAAEAAAKAEADRKAAAAAAKAEADRKSAEAAAKAEADRKAAEAEAEARARAAAERRRRDQLEAERASRAQKSEQEREYERRLREAEQRRERARFDALRDGER